jgi:hypothetical protein
VDIFTQIEVAGSSYPYSEEQAAAQVLAALGGNPADDTSKAQIMFHQLRITTNVDLGAGDNMPYTPDGAATQVLAAIAGNPTTDSATASISMQTTSGHAGVPPTGV